MSDPFESPKILLARAQERAADLEKRLKAFAAKRPYTNIIEFDDQSGMFAHKIKIVEKIPKEARADAFEISSSLRSALDQVVWGSAVAITGGKPKITKFPFGDTAADLENDIKRGCKDVPVPIVALLRQFKAHQGGNDPLWALNKMRNTKNHQILAAMAFISGGMGMNIGSMTVSGAAQIGMHIWNAEKQELTYMRTAKRDGVQGQFDVQAAIEIVLEDVPILGGQPAVAVFHHLCREVGGIIGAVEAETFRVLAASKT